VGARSEAAGSPEADSSQRWAASRGHRSARVEPLSPDRHRVQFTASAELRDKLERLKNLMRPSVLDGDLAAIIEALCSAPNQHLARVDFGPTTAARHGRGNA
jgi:hypothetical protein